MCMTKNKKVFKMIMEDSLNNLEVDTRSDYVGESGEVDWDFETMDEEQLQKVMDKGGYRVVGRD
jgi:hypothetical protein